MTNGVMEIGNEIASDISSESTGRDSAVVRTLGDLLTCLEAKRPPALAMLRTTCSRLSAFFDKPVTEISIDDVVDSREEFRAFLQGRKYARNSIRTFVNYTRILISLSSKHGWEPGKEIREEWRKPAALAEGRHCRSIVTYFSKRFKSPSDVTNVDINDWILKRVQQGHSLKNAQRMRGQLWRILREAGCAIASPNALLREKNYGVPLEKLPTTLRSQLLDILKWKQAKFALNRPKGGRHRAISSRNLRRIVCGLYGFAANILGERGISSFAELIRKNIVAAFVEWCINERAVSGRSLAGTLGVLYAALRYRESDLSLNLSWFKQLMGSLPTDDDSASKARKMEKYLDYRELESIPDRIRSDRLRCDGGIRRVAQLAMEELMIKWLTILPWRQRNIRECRIGGRKPNLFKAKVPEFSDIDKPQWVIEEEKRNPDLKVWQFHFDRDETKTGIEVAAILPRPLVPLLEEYLDVYRPNLTNGEDPGTLFLNRSGKAIEIKDMTNRVCSITMRYAGKRVNPHVFRDIVAFTWLKEHPRDYLTLSKVLWHSNLNTTIKIYGSRFNESSGVCAMEAWIEERERRLPRAA